MAPYLVLVTILNGRVHRNTKLGLYNMVSNDPKSQPHAAAYNMVPGNSHPGGAKPVSMAVTSVDGYSAYSTTKPRGSRTNSLDFGMV
jgi:hypothetical protein